MVVNNSVREQALACKISDTFSFSADLRQKYNFEVLTNVIEEYWNNYVKDDNKVDRLIKKQHTITNQGLATKTVVSVNLEDMILVYGETDDRGYLSEVIIGHLAGHKEYYDNMVELFSAAIQPSIPQAAMQPANMNDQPDMFKASILKNLKSQNND